MVSEIVKLRTSKNNNDIFAIPLGTVEGTKAKFTSGNKGYRMFGRVLIGDKQYQLTGQLVSMK